jgi:hypothetical protein
MKSGILKILILGLAISAIAASKTKTSKEDEELFPWDIGDLTDDPVSEEEIFSKTKKYVSFVLLSLNWS